MAEDQLRVQGPELKERSQKYCLRIDSAVRVNQPSASSFPARSAPTYDANFPTKELLIRLIPAAKVEQLFLQEVRDPIRPDM